MNGVYTSVLPSLGSGLEFDWLPEFTSYHPGQTFRLAWQLSSLLLSEQAMQAATGWRTASLELALSATDEVLWRHSGFRWPPPVEVGYVIQRDPSGAVRMVPVAWPPAGYTIEGPLSPATPSARQDLYNGFGEKDLELRLIGPGESPRIFRATRSIWIQPESISRYSISAPSFVEIGAEFVVSGTVVNDRGNAALSLTATTTQTNVWDSTTETYPPVGFDVPAFGVLAETIATPLRVSWQWVDKPTYHVHDGDLERDASFDSQATCRDEFGNAYPRLSASPIVVRVRVSETKVAAARAAETFYWTNVGIVIGVAIIGTVLTVASAGFAGPEAGVLLAFIVGYVGITGAEGGAAASYGYGGWAAVADDPVAPAMDYWNKVTLPAARVPPSETLTAFIATTVEVQRIASLILSMSTVEGRVLGAAAKAAPEALQLQIGQLAELRQSLVAAMTLLADRSAKALDELRQLPVSADQIAAGVEELRSTGVTETVRDKLLSIGISLPAVNQLEKALKTRGIEAAKDLLSNVAKLHKYCLLAGESALADSGRWIARFSNGLPQLTEA